MFSGPLEKTIISLGAGLLIGIADAVGFFYTAQMFVKNATSGKRTVAGVLEAARLLVLCGVVLFLYNLHSFSILWLLGMTLIVSLGGKFFFIFKRLKT
jgi:hypothetical protein